VQPIRFGGSAKLELLQRQALAEYLALALPMGDGALAFPALATGTSPRSMLAAE
jgi:hypothetical protein